jgi:hypothetical protein
MKPNLKQYRFERAPLLAQVEYELTNAGGGPARVRKSLASISSNGLFITTEEPIIVGRRMVVRFELPNKHRIIVVARACYRRKSRGVGVEYLRLDHEDYEELEAAITSQKRFKATLRPMQTEFKPARASL